MRKSRLLVTGALLSLFLCTKPAGAVGSCLTCDTDYYGQNICVLVASIGPEGGTKCYSGTWGCVTSQPCMWT